MDDATHSHILCQVCRGLRGRQPRQRLAVRVQRSGARPLHHRRGDLRVQAGEVPDHGVSVEGSLEALLGVPMRCRIYGHCCRRRHRDAPGGDHALRNGFPHPGRNLEACRFEAQDACYRRRPGGGMRQKATHTKEHSLHFLANATHVRTTRAGAEFRQLLAITGAQFVGDHKWSSNAKRCAAPLNPAQPGSRVRSCNSCASARLTPQHLENELCS